MTQTTASTSAPTPDALEIRDSRTDATYKAVIKTEGPEGDTYVRAMDLRAVKRDASEFGILRYRGYPIEQLAEKATFLETAYLLRHGDLPNQGEYDKWVHDITYHTYV